MTRCRRQGQGRHLRRWCHRRRDQGREEQGRVGFELPILVDVDEAGFAVEAIEGHVFEDASIGKRDAMVAEFERHEGIRGQQAAENDGKTEREQAGAGAGKQRGHLHGTKRRAKVFLGQTRSSTSVVEGLDTD